MVVKALPVLETEFVRQVKTTSRARGHRLRKARRSELKVSPHRVHQWHIADIHMNLVLAGQQRLHIGNSFRTREGLERLLSIQDSHARHP